MFGSNRRYLIAAFGWLILVASPPSQAAEGDKANSQQPNSTELSRIASALEKLPAAPSPDPGCQPGQDDRGSDLCAQWKAADSALSSAIWAERSFYAGLLGLLIGAGTLLFAGRAAHWAKQAAIETKRAADAAAESLSHSNVSLELNKKALKAAQDSNRIANSAARKQVRPWLTIDLVDLKSNGTTEIDGSKKIKTRLTFKIRNSGPMPAVDVAYKTLQVYVSGKADADTVADTIIPRPSGEWHNGFVLAPNALSIEIETACDAEVPVNSPFYDAQFLLLIVVHYKAAGEIVDRRAKGTLLAG